MRLESNFRGRHSRLRFKVELGGREGRAKIVIKGVSKYKDYDWHDEPYSGDQFSILEIPQAMIESSQHPAFFIHKMDVAQRLLQILNIYDDKSEIINSRTKDEA
jgi:hypothetical protein